MFVILGINYAIKGKSYQKSTYGNNEIYSARFANDGKIDSGYSNTKQSTSRNWWKVDLGKKIIFQFARVYARTGRCNENPCGMICMLITEVMLA